MIQGFWRNRRNSPVSWRPFTKSSSIPTGNTALGRFGFEWNPTGEELGDARFAKWLSMAFTAPMPTTAMVSRHRYLSEAWWQALGERPQAAKVAGFSLCMVDEFEWPSVRRATIGCRGSTKAP